MINKNSGFPRLIPTSKYINDVLNDTQSFDNNSIIPIFLNAFIFFPGRRARTQSCPILQCVSMTAYIYFIFYLSLSKMKLSEKTKVYIFLYSYLYFYGLILFLIVIISYYTKIILIYCVYFNQTYLIWCIQNAEVK